MNHKLGPNWYGPPRGHSVSFSQHHDMHQDELRRLSGSECQSQSHQNFPTASLTGLPREAIIQKGNDQPWNTSNFRVRSFAFQPVSDMGIEHTNSTHWLSPHYAMLSNRNHSDGNASSSNFPFSPGRQEALVRKDNNYNISSPPLDLHDFNPSIPPPTIVPVIRRHEINISNAVPPQTEAPTHEFCISQQENILESLQPAQGSALETLPPGLVTGSSSEIIEITESPSPSSTPNIPTLDNSFKRSNLKANLPNKSLVRNVIRSQKRSVTIKRRTGQYITKTNLKSATLIDLTTDDEMLSSVSTSSSFPLDTIPKAVTHEEVFNIRKFCDNCNPEISLKVTVEKLQVCMANILVLCSSKTDLIDGLSFLIEQLKRNINRFPLPENQSITNKFEPAGADLTTYLNTMTELINMYWIGREKSFFNDKQKVSELLILLLFAY